MNPLLPIEYLVFIFAAVIIAGAYLSWRSSVLAPSRIRGWIVCLRILALFSLGLIAFDFGYWKEKMDDLVPEWAIMLDVSESMNVKDADSLSRLKAAAELVDEITADRDDIKVFPFAGNLHSPLSSKNKQISELTAGGKLTDISGSGTSLLRKYSDSGKSLKGILILSDGRETALDKSYNFPLLARAGKTPLFAVCYGGLVAEKDISLKPGHHHYTLFTGQEQSVSVDVKNSNMGKVKSEVRILDSKGAVLDSRIVELDNNSVKTVDFKLKLKDPGYHELWFEIPDIRDEKSTENNRHSIVVSVIDEKLNVLMIEGLPFWDSKFLSQVLRRNKNINFTGIYRLSSVRFFRIQEDDNSDRESSDVIFPDSMDELSGYNLIIFGKGAEYFLNEDRVRMLKSYIRDFGGAVLFARGKPYSGTWRGLHAIEPVVWGEMISSPFQWTPDTAGEACGLFGEMLPGMENPIWGELPSVDRAFRCPELRSFAEVLVSGKTSSMNGVDIPVLISRKIGKGIVLAVNSEGLWKWDFFPLKGKTGDFYRNFWTQLVFWTVKYSDFLPNQDFSLNLSKGIVKPGEDVVVLVNSRRKVNPAQKINVKISRGGVVIKEVVPASSMNRKGWSGVFTIDTPGTYRVSLNMSGMKGDEIFLPLLVTRPLSENDNLSSDRESLSYMVKKAGGKIVAPDEVAGIFSEDNSNREEYDVSDRVWSSVWNRWWFLIPLLLFLGLECYLRRRNGML